MLVRDGIDLGRERRNIVGRRRRRIDSIDSCATWPGAATVNRELKRKGGQESYQVAQADSDAWGERLGPNVAGSWTYMFNIGALHVCRTAALPAETNLREVAHRLSTSRAKAMN